jgi:hypothetical protein
MPRRRSLLATHFYCEHCQKETRFMPIHFAIQEIGVSRTTMYRWMQCKQVHWLEKPSGRAMICLQSLMQRAQEAGNVTSISKHRPPKNPQRTA